MGGKSTTISTSEPRLSGLRIQTSEYGLTIPLIWGRARVPGNLTWYGDFKAIARTSTSSSGGKGGGGGVTQSTTTYTYQAAVILTLASGTVRDVVSVWRGKQRLSGYDVGEKKINQTWQQTVTAGVPYVVAGSDWRGTVLVEAVDVGTGTGESWIGDQPYTYSYSIDEPYTRYTNSGGTYTFSDSIEVRVTWIKSVAGYWVSALSELKMNLFYGTYEQPVWSYLSTKHPTQALGYSTFAHVVGEAYQLTNNAEVHNHNFEVSTTSEFSSSIVDANPKDIMAGFLTDARNGALWPAIRLGDLTAYENYCVSHGIFLSPVMAEQRPANEWINDLLQLTNSDVLWSEAKLKFLPRGDSAKTANGKTYSPNTTPVFDLTDDDFLSGGGDTVLGIARKGNDEASNIVTLEIENRNNSYNTEPVRADDLAHIEQFGKRPKELIKASAIKDPQVAQFVAQMLVQREIAVRNEYSFKLGFTKDMLEPGDLVTLTYAPAFLDRVPVRIVEMTEADEGRWNVLAEDCPIGFASAPLYGVQAGSGFAHDYNKVPGGISTPVIFEAPIEHTVTGLELYIAVSGSTADWGGCRIWVSYDDLTYREMDTVYGGARYGSLRAGLAAGVGGVAQVQLAGQGGQLISASAEDVANDATLCWVGDTSGGEYFAYQTASLVATNQYDLGTLWRGRFTNPTPARSTGAQFVRLDQAIAKSGSLPLDLIGKPLYFKFTSFNVYGGGEESLADVTAVTYTVPGYQAGLPPSAVTAASATVEEFGVRIKITPIADVDVRDYVIRQGGSDWASATPLDGAVETVAQQAGYFWRIQTAGAKTLRIRARDALGNVSTSDYVLSVNIPAPTATGLTAAFAGTEVFLQWTGVPGQTAIREYLVDYDNAGSWVQWDRAMQTESRKQADWLGARLFRVRAVDEAGNIGSPSTTTATVVAPAAPVVSIQALTNRVILTATDSANTLPIEVIEVRRGAASVAWASAPLIGFLGTGRILVYEENVGGDYDYLMRATDSAGNQGSEGRANALVADPPNFRRFADYDSNFTLGTRTNALIEAATGKLLAPFNDTETEASHFSTRSWASDADKIAAGYSYIAHPTSSTGVYEETIDYGIAITASKIDVALTQVPLVGSVNVQVRISVKTLLADPWIDSPLGFSSIFATNFRYAKVRLEFTSQASGALGQYGVLSCDKVKVTLSTERKTDSGTATANSGDTTGTRVNFNRTDFDIPPNVQVSPVSTAARIAVVDPGSVDKTGFDVYLFESGVRATGSVSWQAEQGI